MFLLLNITGKFGKHEGLGLSVFLEILKPAIGLDY
jgi:hypothetical protein